MRDRDEARLQELVALLEAGGPGSAESLLEAVWMLGTGGWYVCFGASRDGGEASVTLLPAGEGEPVVAVGPAHVLALAVAITSLLGRCGPRWRLPSGGL